MKVGFKGLSTAKGGGGFRVYDKGDYLVKCTKMNYDDGEEKQKPPSFFFQGVIEKGPEQTDGTDVAGMNISGFFNVDENSEWFEKQVGALKEMCDAFGVPINKKDDTFDPDKFIDQTGTIRVVVKTNNKTGEPLNNIYGVAPSKSKYNEE